MRKTLLVIILIAVASVTASAADKMMPQIFEAVCTSFGRIILSIREILSLV